MNKQKITFRAGNNIAMKVPSHQYDQTVTFYKDIIGLPQIKNEEPKMVFKFGDKKLWIDREKHLSQAEIWLELQCSHLEEAKKYLTSEKIIRRDEVEQLPKDFKGFWITSPSNIIHLITTEGDQDSRGQ